jgi:hypothetical protein
MTKPLSPAAQAVLAAIHAAPDDTRDSYRSAGAAALRAAADQVVPRRRKPMYADSGEESAWSAQQDTRDELLAIAYELEAH